LYVLFYRAGKENGIKKGGKKEKKFPESNGEGKKRSPPYSQFFDPWFFPWGKCQDRDLKCLPLGNLLKGMLKPSVLPTFVLISFLLIAFIDLKILFHN